MSAQSNEIVVALARNFMALLQTGMPGWNRAFFRFDADDLKYGSIASYERDGKVNLIDPFETSDFYSTMNEMAVDLREAMSRSEPRFRVLLLTVDSSFDYEIRFENADPLRWRITKMDGGSGIPVGLT
ncbi:hypothetical protein EJO66_32305 [Variovorax beijingensis]|uniref:Uncharacterized protein n=1 Tax=Variovorax beijingensis TaxID=2496117 RepID=A0ABX9ZWF0_9BURK|nr:hypothetical protein [Variovorax beijingensis]RSZ23976.1 hypothetical protein EJO66_32305 [Variovorax beijingensis]